MRRLLFVMLAGLAFADTSTPAKRQPWVCQLPPEERKRIPADIRDDLDELTRLDRRVTVAPDGLTRREIIAAMRAVYPHVACCHHNFGVPGLAMVAVTVAPSGKVTSATVSGSFAHTPTGSCVEGAAKLATFRVRKDELVSFNYPFLLR